MLVHLRKNGMYFFEMKFWGSSVRVMFLKCKEKKSVLMKRMFLMLCYLGTQSRYQRMIPCVSFHSYLWKQILTWFLQNIVTYKYILQCRMSIPVRTFLLAKYWNLNDIQIIVTAVAKERLWIVISYHQSIQKELVRS